MNQYIIFSLCFKVTSDRLLTCMAEGKLFHMWFLIHTSGFATRPVIQCSAIVYVAAASGDVAPDTRQCHAVQPAAGLHSSVTHGIGSVSDIPECSNGFNSKDQRKNIHKDMKITILCTSTGGG